ncbi:hypothetical protein ACFX2G_016340 [Malus domestica]
MSTSGTPQFRYTQTPSKVLHLHNLPWECAEEELIELCKPFGKIVNTKCNVGANRNQAFVEFSDLNQAINMVSYYASSSEPAQVRGKTVYIQYSNRHEIVNNKSPGDVPGNVLLVTIEGVEAGDFSDAVTASMARNALDGRSIPRYLLPENVGSCNLRISYSAPPICEHHRHYTTTGFHAPLSISNVSTSSVILDSELGKQLHAHAHKLGCSGDRYVVAALIELYGRLDSADSAKWLFDKSLVKDYVSWTMLARLYIAEGKPGKAVHVFERMVESGAQIDSVAVATAAGACGMLRSLIDGTKVHRVAKERGLGYDVLVSNTLLKMYMDCGCVDEAWAVFNQMPEKDVISCTEMIRANVKRGCFNEGLKLFRQMVGDGVKPDPLSVSSVLPACARMSAGKHGKETRGFLLRHGIRMNLTVLNALVDMYVKSGFIKSAAKVFARLKYRDLVSWTVMITGYSLHGQGKIGVDLFCQMEKETSTQIDEITYAAVLHACVAARMVEEGKFYFNCIKTPTVAHCAFGSRHA